MITKLVLTSVLSLLISSGWMIGSHVKDATSSNEVQTERKVVKAILHDGELMPRVDLPVVEISGELNTDLMQNAVVDNGNVYPHIELETIIITPNS